jgi:hypothetical protein
MQDEPVYTLGDAIDVCLQDSWQMLGHEYFRGKSRTTIRQQHIQAFTVEVFVNHDNRSHLAISFRNYRWRVVESYHWPLETVGQDLYRIPQGF